MAHPITNLKLSAMRAISIYIKTVLWAMALCAALTSSAQEQQEAKKKPKPVKNTFEGAMIGDVQTVMVPSRNTLTFDIQHRFGTWKKGYEDFFGLFASSNIRLGATYSFGFCPNLNVGVGFTKANMLWDLDAKYAILRQTKGRYPVSVTYYGSMEVDTRKRENFIYNTDRFSYFHELLVARKVSDKLSVQVAPSWTHVNSVNSYYSAGKIKQEMNHEHFAVAFTGKYKLKETMAVFFNYHQPLTKHNANNPHPNLQLGLEMNTSGHSFQFFAGNYYAISPVRNSMFNRNDFTKGEYLIGFNISRLWTY